MTRLLQRGDPCLGRLNERAPPLLPSEINGSLGHGMGPCLHWKLGVVSDATRANAITRYISSKRLGSSELFALPVRRNNNKHIHLFLPEVGGRP